MSQGSGARVLIIDDDQAILHAVETNLGRHDFRVDTAATAGEAMEANARLRPDLILLDLGLPDMDGLEVIREIRARSSTPIVVLSRAPRAGQGCRAGSGRRRLSHQAIRRERVVSPRSGTRLRDAAKPSTGTDPVISVGDLQVILSAERCMSADPKCISRQPSGTSSSRSPPTLTKCSPIA